MLLLTLTCYDNSCCLNPDPYESHLFILVLFQILRGIADYKDGARRSEWQPYAALAAASVMKTMICGLEVPSDT